MPNNNSKSDFRKIQVFAIRRALKWYFLLIPSSCFRSSSFLFLSVNSISLQRGETHASWAIKWLQLQWYLLPVNKGPIESHHMLEMYKFQIHLFDSQSRFAWVQNLKSSSVAKILAVGTIKNSKNGWNPTVPAAYLNHEQTFVVCQKSEFYYPICFTYSSL